MEKMSLIDSIDSVVNAISGVLYQPYIVPLILVGAGLFFTFRSKFIQVRLFKEMFKVVSGCQKEQDRPGSQIRQMYRGYDRGP